MIKGNKKVKLGSITVEASLVMPLFIYGIIAFLYFSQILYIQECVQASLTETAKEASRYGFIYDDFKKSSIDNNMDSDAKEDQNKQTICKRLLDGTFFQINFNENLSKFNISDTCLVGGRAGILLYLSSFMSDNEAIDVIVAYQIKIPVALIKINGFTMIQRVKSRAFIGQTIKDNSEGADCSEDDPIVYITETGKVYHLDKQCTHLKLSIQSIVISEVSRLRNKNGAIYKPCEKCAMQAKLSNNEVVYITTEGNRYHTSLNCSGLKRTIFEVLLSKVKDRNVCSRCKK